MVDTFPFLLITLNSGCNSILYRWQVFSTALLIVSKHSATTSCRIEKIPVVDERGGIGVWLKQNEAMFHPYWRPSAGEVPETSTIS